MSIVGICGSEKIGMILLPLFSFAWGFFIMSCIIELGGAGLVVGLASVLPHGVLYCVGIGLLLGRRNARKYHLKNQVAMNAGIYVFMIVLFITAIVIESLVGVHFSPWVIRLSLV